MREAAWRGQGSAAPHLMPMRPSYRRRSPPAKWPPGPTLPQARSWPVPAGSPPPAPRQWAPGSSGSQERGAPGEKELPWWARVRWRAAILARALLVVPRRWARSTPTALSPALLAGTILVHFSFTRQHTLPGPCLCPLRRLCPCRGFSLGREWAYPHMGSHLPQCVPLSSEGCQALDWPWKTRPGQILRATRQDVTCPDIRERVMGKLYLSPGQNKINSKPKLQRYQ